MAKWRALVADDEPAARRGVRQLLSAFPRFTVVGEARNGREVLAALPLLKPDVLFLDIRMPEIGGLAVTRARTSTTRPLIVFLTAFEQFALDAFDAEAVDYLVKPVSEERFASTIERLERRLRLDSTAAVEPTIAVASARGVVMLSIHEIDWIEAADYYVRLWVGGRTHLLRDSLDQLERRLANHGFARAHRGALVRIAGVRALRSNKTGGLIALLACGATVPISRRRRTQFTGAVRAG